MADLEPASALAERICRLVHGLPFGQERDVAALIEAIRADVREPLERRIADLEAANFANHERIASLEAQLAPARELRPVVVWFAQQMEAKLRENDHKGGWHTCKVRWLLKRAGQELKELHECVFAVNAPGCGCREAFCPHVSVTPRPTGAETISEAADVANMAMMVADHFRKDGPSEDSGRSGFELPPPAAQKESSDGT